MTFSPCPKPVPKAKRPPHPIPRSGRPRPVNRKRKASEFARCYGSKSRVAFVKSLCCAWCGVEGYSENAHVGDEGSGAGRKANADQIAPLCGPHMLSDGNWYRGHHADFDQWRVPFDTEAMRSLVIGNAAKTERMWLAFQASGGEEL